MRGRHQSFQHAGLQSRIRNDEPNVGVAVAEAAVLGILHRRAGVDRAVLRLHDHVRSAAVLQRVVELQLQVGPAHDFVNEQRQHVGVQVVGHLFPQALVLQPDQRDVVVVDETTRPGSASSRTHNRLCGGIGAAIRQSRNQIRKMPGLVGLHRIDRRLAMLRRDDEKG